MALEKFFWIVKTLRDAISKDRLKKKPLVDIFKLTIGNFELSSLKPSNKTFLKLLNVFRERMGKHFDNFFYIDLK